MTVELLKNPKRVSAGRANRRKRGPLTEAGRQRLREAALVHEPWRHATGPRTAAGRAQAARNGKQRQRGPQSVREIRAALAPVRELLDQMREARQQVSDP